MADFVAVLKKTLDGLSDTTPQTREKVYEKARITIAGKLTAMNPPLPEAVVARQKQALEEAIVQVEAEFNRKTADPLSELESVFASLKNPDPRAVLKEPVKAPVPPPEKLVVEAPATEQPAMTARPAPAAAPHTPPAMPAYRGGRSSARATTAARTRSCREAGAGVRTSRGAACLTRTRGFPTNRIIPTANSSPAMMRWRRAAAAMAASLRPAWYWRWLPEAHTPIGRSVIRLKDYWNARRRPVRHFGRA